MKYLQPLFLLFSVLISTVTFSQEIKSNSNSQNSIIDSFRIMITDDSLSIVLQNKYLPLKDIQQFDTYLKNNHPDLSQSFVFIQSPIETKYERKKELLFILSKYHNQESKGINYKSQ